MSDVRIDRATRTLSVELTVSEAKDLGEFLANEGNDPLGVDLYRKAAELAGWDVNLLSYRTT
jgi:hypothetical protein